jgi:hypothetical chaperone protein
MYFEKSGNITFGHNAIKIYSDDAAEGRFIRSIKKYLPLSSFVSTRINNSSYRLEHLIGRFLKEMKNRADQILNQDVTNVVLGRPAKFSMDEDKDKLAETRLLKAAEYAGFKNVEFAPEPLAAAFHYRKGIKNESIILIVDLGGGTSDFTVVKLSPISYSDKDVLAIGGLSKAGDAIDGELMAEKLAVHFGTKVKYRLPLSQNILSMPNHLKFKLMSPADITLMSNSDIYSFLKEVETNIVNEDDEIAMTQLQYLISENLGFSLFNKIEQWKKQVCIEGFSKFEFIEGDIEITEDLDFVEFNRISEPVLDLIFSELNEVLKASGVNANTIDAICCTGGTSKLPEVRSRLAAIFSEEKIKTMDSFQSVIDGLAEITLLKYQ